MKQFLLLALTFVIFTLHGICYGVELSKEFKTQDGFFIRLPDNWKAIPTDMLDAYSDAVTKLAPGTERQKYNYGFQRSDTDRWFVYPYVLVQVKKTGRVPEAQLKSLTQLQGDLDKTMAKLQGTMSQVVSGARLNDTIYDPAAHILFTQIRMDVKELGSIRGLVGVVLTEQGVIQIAGYAKAEDFSQYLPVFERVIRGITLEDSLKYRPRMMESVPVVGGVDWDRVISHAAIGGGVGLLIALLALFLRKRRSRGA